VEAVCNRIIIINKGKIVADGGIKEVKSGNLKHNQIVIVEFNAAIKPEILLAVKGIKNAVLKDNFWEIESEKNQDIRPSIFQFAVENKLTLLTLTEKQQNLESVFHQLTQ